MAAWQFWKRATPTLTADAAQSPKPTRGILRSDGWANVLNGLGISGRDKTQSTQYLQRAPIDYATQTALHRQDWVGRRVVDAVVADCFRAGFQFVSKDDDELAAKVHDAWRIGDFQAQLALLFRWGLVYGGALGVMLTDDNPLDLNLTGALAQPLDLGSIKTLHRLLVVDARYVVPDLSRITSDPKSPNFGLPESYTVTPYGTLSSAQYIVHWTRCLRMSGADADAETRFANKLWGDSIYEALFDALRFRGQMMQSVATTAAEFSQGVLAVKDLSLNLASAQEGAIVTRATAFRQGLGTAGLALIDSEFEKYERMGQPITGLPDLIKAFAMEAAGAIRMPESRLFGNQAGKLAGADADHENWAEYVHGWQIERIVPVLSRLTDVLIACKTGPTNGRPVVGWKIEPNALQAPDDDAEVKRHKLQAETDEIYYKMNVLEPVEIRNSRFGEAGWSVDTTLDPAISAALAASAVAEASQPNVEEPAPDAAAAPLPTA